MIRGTLGFCCDIDANRLDSQPFSPPPVRTLKVSTALLHMGTSSPPTPSLNPSNHSWMGIGAVQLASALGIYCEERGIPAANILCFSNKEPFVNQSQMQAFRECASLGGGVSPDARNHRPLVNGNGSYFPAYVSLGQTALGEGGWSGGLHRSTRNHVFFGPLPMSKANDYATASKTVSNLLVQAAVQKFVLTITLLIQVPSEAVATTVGAESEGWGGNDEGQVPLFQVFMDNGGHLAWPIHPGLSEATPVSCFLLRGIPVAEVKDGKMSKLLPDVRFALVQFDESSICASHQPRKIKANPFTRNSAILTRMEIVSKAVIGAASSAYLASSSGAGESLEGGTNSGSAWTDRHALSVNDRGELNNADDDNGTLVLANPQVGVSIIYSERAADLVSATQLLGPDVKSEGDPILFFTSYSPDGVKPKVLAEKPPPTGSANRAKGVQQQKAGANSSASHDLRVDPANFTGEPGDHDLHQKEPLTKWFSLAVSSVQAGMARLAVTSLNSVEQLGECGIIIACANQHLINRSSTLGSLTGSYFIRLELIGRGLTHASPLLVGVVERVFKRSMRHLQDKVTVISVAPSCPGSPCRSNRAQDYVNSIVVWLECQSKDYISKLILNLKADQQFALNLATSFSCIAVGQHAIDLNPQLTVITVTGTNGNALELPNSRAISLFLLVIARLKRANIFSATEQDSADKIGVSLCNALTRSVDVNSLIIVDDISGLMKGQPLSRKVLQFAVKVTDADVSSFLEARGRSITAGQATFSVVTPKPGGDWPFATNSEASERCRELLTELAAGTDESFTALAEGKEMSSAEEIATRKAHEDVVDKLRSLKTKKDVEKALLLSKRNASSVKKAAVTPTVPNGEVIEINEIPTSPEAREVPQLSTVITSIAVNPHDPLLHQIYSIEAVSLSFNMKLKQLIAGPAAIQKAHDLIDIEAKGLSVKNQVIIVDTAVHRNQDGCVRPLLERIQADVVQGFTPNSIAFIYQQLSGEGVFDSNSVTMSQRELLASYLAYLGETFPHVPESSKADKFLHTIGAPHASLSLQEIAERLREGHLDTGFVSHEALRPLQWNSSSKGNECTFGFIDLDTKTVEFWANPLREAAATYDTATASITLIDPVVLLLKHGLAYRLIAPIAVHPHYSAPFRSVRATLTRSLFLKLMTEHEKIHQLEISNRKAKTSAQLDLAMGSVFSTPTKTRLAPMYDGTALDDGVKRTIDYSEELPFHRGGDKLPAKSAEMSC